MVNSHESFIQFDDWRTTRLIETLFHAEKFMPGVWRLLKTMKVHAGVLVIELYSDRFELEIKDTFEAAWEKVGEDPDRVEVRYRK
jgi:hypothetical protein